MRRLPPPLPISIRTCDMNVLAPLAVLVLLLLLLLLLLLCLFFFIWPRPTSKLQPLLLQLPFSLRRCPRFLLMPKE